MVAPKVAIYMLIGSLVLAGLSGCESSMHAQAVKQFAPPGLLVAINGRSLQIDCRGSGSPTVVLESGGDDIFGSLGWSNVHDDIAALTRVCAYSRAGYMWSDSRSQALEPEDAARDLRTALDLAGESSPFVLTGYSRGAFNTLIFTDLFGADVAALVLLEPRHPELEARRAQLGIRQGSEPRLVQAKFGRALRWTGLPRAFSGYCEAAWYPTQIIDACRAYFPHSLDGMISEDSALESVRMRAANVHDLGNRPVLVLTRQLKDVWLGAAPDTRAATQKSEDLWRELHAEMASWSSRGVQQIVPDSSHQLPYTHPQQVVDAISKILDQVHQLSSQAGQ